PLRRRSIRFPAARTAFVVAAILALVPGALTACSVADEVDSATPELHQVEQAEAGLEEGEEVPEIESTASWVNAIATPAAAQAMLDGMAGPGSVVLIEFWSQTCLACLADRAYFAELHHRYSAHGLTVVGIHAPDFTFEEDPEAIEEVALQYRIPYPILTDSDRAVSAAFEVEGRPARYLVDAEGLIAHRHLGSGGYAATEDAVRDTLVASGVDAATLPAIRLAGATGEDGVPMSRDLFFGYRHNYHPSGVYAAQPEYYEAPEGPLVFIDPGHPREEGVWYAHGTWSVDDDSLVHAREAEAAPDYIVFRFQAGHVSLLMASEAGAPTEVIVQIDGVPIRPDFAGDDVQWDEAGRSIVAVDGRRLYDIADFPQVTERQMRLSIHEEGVAIFLASFAPPGTPE
ncbi:MAG: redoxin domain-containing protein, partial [Chloroflexi bacterium]|nr:redoxin domain-containing protein [Chloroflexota bacterium]